MNVAHKFREALRGNVNPGSVLLEAGRRLYLAPRKWQERQTLASRFQEGALSTPQTARLAPPFSKLSPAMLLAHFRRRLAPHFFPGMDSQPNEGGASLSDPSRLLHRAQEILSHQWSLLGFGKLDFGTEIDWLRDPVTGVRWPLDYHRDMKLVRGDGSDIRVLWELNRLGHLVTLAQAYAVSGDERFAEKVLADIEGWRVHNPFGYGPNWACAMEVALRAMNLLASFELTRSSAALNERRLTMLLSFFEEHGNFIRRHLEFSYIATGNHYLADLAGLLWIGLYLPELHAAADWCQFALKELLREMNKQVLADGVDCEASTGYHRFVTELFLYSFMLCRVNGIEIEEKYWQLLRSMLEYLRAYLRPDGKAPLIGDTDGGQALPLFPRSADEHDYLLAIAAVLFKESAFKIEEEVPPELSWLFGADGIQAYRALQTAGRQTARSIAFQPSGVCILRDRDLYLLLSAKGVGLRGRGAHGHNDALSIEVSAGGVSFLSDPGSYIYTGDLGARHAFRSTRYHSTVEVDGGEQNEIDVNRPFVMIELAKPRILHWESDETHDLVIAEHYGYHGLRAGTVTHRRAIRFERQDRYWLIEDTFSGKGTHDLRFIFHAAPGRECRMLNNYAIEIQDPQTDSRLVIAPLESLSGMELEQRWSSRHYGSKVATTAACWTVRADAPFNARWLLLPISAAEDPAKRGELIEQLRTKIPELKTKG